jgi:hypothetical protein
MTKAKRQLKDISFDGENAHMAVVGKQAGGPANGKDFFLTLKSNNSYSEETIQKASTVKLELEITEYLRRFYDLYWDQSEVLARSLGFTTAQMDYEAKEKAEDSTEYVSWIDEQVKSIEVIKSFKDSKNVLSDFVKLSEDQYLQFIQDQELVEKAFKLIEQNSSKVNTKVENGSTDTVAKSAKLSESRVDPETKVTKGKSMSGKTETSPELIEKSVLTEVQKALDEKAVELQKALDLISQMKQKEKEAITKSRFETLKSAVKDETKATTLFKAFSLVESDEDFQAVVKAVGDLVEQVEKSDLFKETGASGAGDESKDESPVLKAVNKMIADKATKTN